MDLNLRPASERDREFLYELHCSTMRDVIEQTWGWDDAWQLAEFERRFEQFSVSVIEVEARPVGSLWLEQRPDSLYIHELQVTPPQQGRGIGTAVVELVIEQGASHCLPTGLSVVPANPRARALYERLGFRVTCIEPPFTRMRHDTRLAGAVYNAHQHGRRRAALVTRITVAGHGRGSDDLCTRSTRTPARGEPSLRGRHSELGHAREPDATQRGGGRAGAVRRHPRMLRLAGTR